MDHVPLGACGCAAVRARGVCSPSPGRAATSQGGGATAPSSAGGPAARRGRPPRAEGSERPVPASGRSHVSFRDVGEHFGSLAFVKLRDDWSGFLGRPWPEAAARAGMWPLQGRGLGPLSWASRWTARLPAVDAPRSHAWSCHALRACLPATNTAAGSRPLRRTRPHRVRVSGSGRESTIWKTRFGAESRLRRL